MFSIENQITSLLGQPVSVCGSEYIYTNCPICHDNKKHFYINHITGLWSCKKCGGDGNIVSLKKQIGAEPDVKILGPKKFSGQKQSPISYTRQLEIVKYHKKLMSNEELLEELTQGWKIDKETAKKFRLGIAINKNKKGEKIKWIVIPTIVHKEIVNVKYRSWFGEEKEFKREYGGKSELFNIDNLNKELNYVILTEGEKDAIVVSDAGVKNVVGLTGGADTFIDTWYDLFESFEKILICMDEDTAGKRGLLKIAKRLGIERCKYVKLPKGMDATDYIHKYSGKAFKKLLIKPQEIPIKFVSDIQTALFEYLNEEKESDEIYGTPWESVNKILNGGFRRGQLITLSGIPKVGKTTTSLYIADYFAQVHKIPSLFFCLEMKTKRLIEKLLTSKYKIHHKALQKSDAICFISEVLSDNYPFYLAFANEPLNIKTLKEVVVEAWKRLGIGLFVFDNIHYMVRHVRDKVIAIEDIVKDMKLITNELDMITIQIAQPKKISVTKIMDYFDIGWSGAFASDSDTIICLFRERTNQSGDLDKFEDSSFSDNLVFGIDAGRYTSGGMTVLNFGEDYLDINEYGKKDMNIILTNLMSKGSDK